METKILQLVDDSIIASCNGDKKKGLDLAKESEYREGLLVKEEEEAGFMEHNWDLTFSVSSEFLT